MYIATFAHKHSYIFQATVAPATPSVKPPGKPPKPNMRYGQSPLPLESPSHAADSPTAGNVRRKPPAMPAPAGTAQSQSPVLPPKRVAPPTPTSPPPPPPKPASMRSTNLSPAPPTPTSPAPPVAPPVPPAPPAAATATTSIPSVPASQDFVSVPSSQNRPLMAADIPENSQLEAPLVMPAARSAMMEQLRAKPKLNRVRLAFPLPCLAVAVVVHAFFAFASQSFACCRSRHWKEPRTFATTPVCWKGVPSWTPLPQRWPVVATTFKTSMTAKVIMTVTIVISNECISVYLHRPLSRLVGFICSVFRATALALVAFACLRAYVLLETKSISATSQPHLLHCFTLVSKLAEPFVCGFGFAGTETTIGREQPCKRNFSKK